MRKLTLFAALCTVALMLGTTGCCNLNTDPYESVDKQTTWEAFLSGIGAHDCRKYPECRPICQYDSKEIQQKTQREWEQFKNYKPLVYTPVGDQFLDNAAILVAKVTAQFHTEVVIPYIEYDANGDLALFEEFSGQVSSFQNKREVSRAEAAQIVWSEWMKQDAAKCARLQNAFGILENQSLINQLSRAIENTRPELQRLLNQDWNREIKRIKRECKDEPFVGYTKVSVVGLQLLPALNNSLAAGNFLLQHFQEQREMDDELIDMVSDLNTVE